MIRFKTLKCLSKRYYLGATLLVSTLFLQTFALAEGTKGDTNPVGFIDIPIELQRRILRDLFPGEVKDLGNAYRVCQSLKRAADADPVLKPTMEVGQRIHALKKKTETDSVVEIVESAQSLLKDLLVIKLSSETGNSMEEITYQNLTPEEKCQVISNLYKILLSVLEQGVVKLVQSEQGSIPEGTILSLGKDERVGGEVLMEFPKLHELFNTIKYVALAKVDNRYPEYFAFFDLMNDENIPTNGILRTLQEYHKAGIDISSGTLLSELYGTLDIKREANKLNEDDKEVIEYFKGLKSIFDQGSEDSLGWSDVAILKKRMNNAPTLLGQ